jgi:spore coat polysaccharide biosynthesis protein SpsF
MIERIKQVSRLDQVIVATTTNTTYDPIAELVESIGGADYYRGSEHDVLKRVDGYQQSNNIDVCVDITGDCPLTDPQIINEVLQAYDNAQPDAVYVGNIDGVSVVPAGFDVQAFSAAALRNTSPSTQ